MISTPEDASPEPDTSAPADVQVTTRGLGRRLVVGALLTVLVISGLALFADVRQLGETLAAFQWWLLAPVLGLTLLNYALRIVKWEIYLRRVEVPRLPLVTSSLIFLSAFSMSVTPGKVGEIIKAFYVRRVVDTPVSRTTAIIAAERITDGLAMLLLAGIGLTQFSYGRPLIALTALGTIALVFVIRQPAVLRAFTRWLERMPVIGRLMSRGMHHVEHFLDASSALYGSRLLVGSVLLGFVSWFCECVALMLILIGLGQEPSWNLLLIATFVHSVSSIFGAISMLPGGLGVAEASVAGMLLLLLRDPAFGRAEAAAATLLIRFATLWFSVLLGFAAIIVLERYLNRVSLPLANSDPNGHGRGGRDATAGARS